MLGTAFWPLSAEVIHQVPKNPFLYTAGNFTMRNFIAIYLHTYNYELQAFFC